MEELIVQYSNGDLISYIDTPANIYNLVKELRNDKEKYVWYMITPLTNKIKSSIIATTNRS